MRLYGRGSVIARKTAAYQRLLDTAFDNSEPAGARQIIRLDVERVQTSCGWGVPVLDYKGERPSLENWAKAKGEAGLELYRREKNAVSIDGFATGFAAEE